VGAAFGWGLPAASSLVLGAAIALRVSIGLRTIGLFMGFGSGVLISAVAFDLVEEAVDKASGARRAAARHVRGLRRLLRRRLADRPVRWRAPKERARRT
jgi:ZIP family zinc transporter